MMAEATTSRRRATGRTLLIVSALGTAGFAGWSMAQLQLSTPETFLAEAWHAFGLVVFAGLFALVAWRPRAYPGLMELTILHSAGMFTLAFINQDAEGSTANMVLHGLLTLALLVAYVVLGCVKAWGRQSTGAPAVSSSARTGGTAKEAPRASSSSSSPTNSSGPAQGTAADSTKKPAPGAQPQRGLDRGTSPANRESSPTTQPGTQPTKPIPQSLPEDRPRG
ncbi:hypothetical protein [Nesterenkonia lutea]|uniref:DUF4383 domain-containing protein n=1 Tax=Nesterenkonia lutea TaxID=272919 RepID=A0ABR9JGF1_9MICC|nr:hypothetical protein [Nesterenkonia lutea]MBE1525014.1 hypothetical protein [Nesterenkonia lutea]